MYSANIIKCQKGKQKGMTFLEVLIALVVIVTGILGAVALQTVAKKSSFDTMQRSLASSLAQDIIDRMRGNNSASLVDYTVGSPYGTKKAPLSTDCSVLANNCNATQLANFDLYEWEQTLMGASTKAGTENAGGLAQGVGCIAVSGNQVTVSVSWQGRTEIADGSGSSTGDASCVTGIAEKKRRQVVVNAFIL